MKIIEEYHIPRATGKHPIQNYQMTRTNNDATQKPMTRNYKKSMTRQK